MKIIGMETIVLSCYILVALVDEALLTRSELVLYCVAISFISGVLAATRESDKALVVFRTGAETAVLGACIAFGAESMGYNSSGIIAAAGLLGMGGHASVALVLSIGKKIINKRFEDSAG